MKFTVYEWPFRQAEFDSLSEAIKWVLNHKPGLVDCCYIENSFGQVVWKGKD